MFFLFYSAGSALLKSIVLNYLKRLMFFNEISLHLYSILWNVPTVCFAANKLVIVLTWFL